MTELTETQKRILRVQMLRKERLRKQKGEYLNEYHKISTEKKLKEIAEMMKNPLSDSEVLKQQLKMHEDIKKNYPQKK